MKALPWESMNACMPSSRAAVCNKLPDADARGEQYAGKREVLELLLDRTDGREAVDVFDFDRKAMVLAVCFDFDARVGLRLVRSGGFHGCDLRPEAGRSSELHECAFQQQLVLRLVIGLSGGVAR